MKNYFDIIINKGVLVPKEELTKEVLDKVLDEFIEKMVDDALTNEQYYNMVKCMVDGMSDSLIDYCFATITIKIQNCDYCPDGYARFVTTRYKEEPLSLHVARTYDKIEK